MSAHSPDSIVPRVVAQVTISAGLSSPLPAARSPAADFAKPVNAEAAILPCNSADHALKLPVSFMRCADAVDVGELQSAWKVALTRWMAANAA
jgi:hypothetical protein